MASEGQHDKEIIYSHSNFPVRPIQTTSSEETQPKNMPYFSKLFQNIPSLRSGESRGLTATDDIQQNRQGRRSTSSVSEQPATMVVGPSRNHLPCHTRTSLEETRPKATAKFPVNSNSRTSQSTSLEETLRKGISALPANTNFSDLRPHHTTPVSAQYHTSATGPPQHYNSAAGPPQPYNSAAGPPQHHTTPVSPQYYTTAAGPPQHHTTSVSPQYHTTAGGPPQHYNSASGPPQQYTSAVSPPQPYTTAVSHPLLSHQAAAVPPEESTTASHIPASRRGCLHRSESLQVGDHNDIYKIAQMTDFKDAKLNQVVINNHYYHCNNSRRNGLHKYVKTESDCRIEVTNRQCSPNDWDGSAATDGSRCGRKRADDLDQDSWGPLKRHKADLTETTYTKSDCWQEMPQRNNTRAAVSASSAEGWDYNSVNHDSEYSQILSRESFMRHSSYEKHEMTSEGGSITLQKCSQSIICITDSVKIFDSDGEMVREGDVLFINSEGGYYGVYVGDGGVTFVDVDGLVTTKTVNENLSIPIATEQIDKSASYYRLQPLGRLETSRRAKDLIGQYFPRSGEDLAWFCRFDVPGVPK